MSAGQRSRKVGKIVKAIGLHRNALLALLPRFDHVGSIDKPGAMRNVELVAPVARPRVDHVEITCNCNRIICKCN